MEEKYIELNRENWNNRVAGHLTSEFYEMDAFRAGKSSLKEIELALLGNVDGKASCTYNVISARIRFPSRAWEQKLLASIFRTRP